MTPRPYVPIVLAGALALAFAVPASSPAWSQERAPQPWRPGEKHEVVPAPQAAYDTLRTPPRDHPMPTPEGVTRTLDLLYQPSVADSIVPLVPLYREVRTDEVLSTYLGALHQDLPPRPYPVLVEGQTVHATVDGLEGQTHVAVMILVPWFGKILPWPYAKTRLEVKIDDAKAQEWTLMFTPGPVMYIPSQRPLPVSNPTLVTIPLAPGRHRMELKLKNLDAQYSFLMLGQPLLSPPAIERAAATH